MAKKKGSTNYPYIAVEGVDKRLIDYALIHMYTLHVDEKVSTIVLDMKLVNKITKLIGYSNSNELEKLIYAYNLYNNYNTYNHLMNKLYDNEVATDDELFNEFVSDGIVAHVTAKAEQFTTEKELLQFFLETLAFFRLYKKGRFANEYIPTLVQLFEERLPEVVMLFEDDAIEDDWIDQLYTYFEFEYELEDDEGLLPSINEDITTIEELKIQMTSLIDQFGQSLNAVDPKEYEELRAMLLEKEEALKSANKLLKNKDEQISKLQKASAAKDKEITTLTKKLEDLKKQDGTKTTELSVLRKTADEATLKYEQLIKRHEATKETMQKELEKAREQAAQPLQLKLNDMKNFYEDKVESLEDNVRFLQQSLNEERMELHALEDEIGRLRQFQEFYATLNSANLKLKAENESLQKELKHMKKQFEQQIKVPQHKATTVVEDDAVQIDEGIFNMLTNNPEEVKRDTEHMATVSAAPITNGTQPQAGAIRVVTEENEINFDELLSNRPE